MRGAREPAIIRLAVVNRRWATIIPMNARPPPRALADARLDDKYRRNEGRVFVSGNQALVRLVLQQRLRDVAAGMNTAGYVSGYRGSPLGRLDMEMWAAGEALAEHHV